METARIDNLRQPGRTIGLKPRCRIGPQLVAVVQAISIPHARFRMFDQYRAVAGSLVIEFDRFAIGLRGRLRSQHQLNLPRLGGPNSKMNAALGHDFCADRQFAIYFLCDGGKHHSVYQVCVLKAGSILAPNLQVEGQTMSAA